MKTRNSLKLQQHFIRSLRASRHLEYFLLASISTILGVRLFLEIAGYPQVGGSQLHVAHVLYGGILMLAGILMLIIFLNHGAETLAVVVAGAGFGLFIDEVGKFVTKDNNYFFRPAVAIMYVIFVAIFLASRYILTYRHFTRTEYLMNSINEMEELPRHNMKQDTRGALIRLLSRYETEDRLAAGLKQILVDTSVSPAGDPGFYQHWKDRLHSGYRKVVATRWFQPAVIVFFVLQLIAAMGIIATILFDAGHVSEDLDLFSFSDWAILFSNLLSAAFIFWGILVIRRNRLRAFQMFERSMLVAIFITQFFLFYRDEFGAVPGFVFDLLLLLAIRFIIERETYAAGERSEEAGKAPVRAAA